MIYLVEFILLFVVHSYFFTLVRKTKKIKIAFDNFNVDTMASNDVI